MKMRALDANGDWTFGRGLSDYLTEQKAVEQAIRVRVLMWQNDCFFAMTSGVDWNARLDVGQRDELVAEVATVILQTEGVVGLNSDPVVVFDPVTRNIRVSFDVVTIYSQSFQDLINQTIGAVS